MLLNLLENGSNNDAKNDQDAVHIITHTYVLVFYAQLYTWLKPLCYSQQGSYAQMLEISAQSMHISFTKAVECSTFCF